MNHPEAHLLEFRGVRIVALMDHGACLEVGLVGAFLNRFKLDDSKKPPQQVIHGQMDETIKTGKRNRNR